MPLDRASLIDLLNRLGDPDDATALAAAREADRQIRDTGRTWDALLIPEEGEAPETIEPDETPPAAVDAIPADGEDLALIDRILATSDLAEATREELNGLREDAVEGSFAEMDRNYLRSLAARLGVR